MTVTAHPRARASALTECTTPAACSSALAAHLTAHPGTVGEVHADDGSLVFELGSCWDPEAFLGALPQARRVIGTTRIIRVPVSDDAAALWSALCDAFEAAVQSQSPLTAALAEWRS